MAVFRSWLVAEMMRRSALLVTTLPTGLYSPSCSRRSSLVCRCGLRSPISSRKSVPSWASSTRPFFSRQAPVKAPLTWPKSSLSSTSWGMAVQFTVTIFLSRRWLCWWMARATSSLPVPLGPVMSTVPMVGATWRMRSKMVRICGESPTSEAKPSRSASTWRRARFSRTMSSHFMALSTVTRMRSWRKGLVT